MNPRRILTCAAALTLVLFMRSLAWADGTYACTGTPSMLIILDHSGSMQEYASGQRKWPQATAAVTSLVSNFGDKIRFGLMLLPAAGTTGGNDCTTGQVDVQVGDYTLPSILATLSSVYPIGATPIATTLANAQTYLNTLDATKPRYVILITDGEESCGGKPVPVVQAMAAAGIKTFVIGLNYGSEMLNQLALAGQTAINPSLRPYYYQVSNATQLQTALQTIVKKIDCCGNSVLDPDETCDVAISSGAGSCAIKCDDGNPCTIDSLSGSACRMTCNHQPVLTVKNGDGCCPPLATFATDSDCPKECGNGVLNSGEACDPGITSGAGKCKALADCDDQDPCTVDSLSGTGCNVQCTHSAAQSDPLKKDGCCPANTYHYQDADCPVQCGPDPDPTKSCVDLCSGVVCQQDQQYCHNGACVDWPTGSAPENGSAEDGKAEDSDGFPPTTGGCGCSLGQAGSTQNAAGGFLMLALLAWAVVCVRRCGRD